MICGLYLKTPQVIYLTPLPLLLCLLNVLLDLCKPEQKITCIFAQNIFKIINLINRERLGHYYLEILNVKI